MAMIGSVVVIVRFRFVMVLAVAVAVAGMTQSRGRVKFRQAMGQKLPHGRQWCASQHKQHDKHWNPRVVFESQSHRWLA